MDFIPEKKLGFGLMRLPLVKGSTDATQIDFEELCKMVDMFIDRGFTYFDTAWMYSAFASESAVKKILTSRHPRESFTLSTKLHSGFFDTLDGRDDVFNAQLEKTGAGFFDYYLIHGIEASMIDKYEKFDCFNWLLDKREKGLVRHAGFSFHDKPEVLDDLLNKHPEMEFVQLQINYLDWESEWIHARACLEVANKHGKPVIVMEPVKGGTLASVPDEARSIFKKMDPNATEPSWALRFAASCPGVMLVLSGMSNLDQMDENTKLFTDFKPLTDEEKAACFEVADVINSQIAIPCTACSYCTEGCPKRIPIPKYFSMYNEDMRENLELKGWTVNISNYGIVSSQGGKASECIECGQCEGVCPQHLPIIKNLKDVAAHYETA